MPIGRKRAFRLMLWVKPMTIVLCSTAVHKNNASFILDTCADCFALVIFIEKIGGRFNT